MDNAPGSQAGYLTDANGGKLAVAMISNNFLDSPQSVEDAVAITLASYSAGAPIAGRRPPLRSPRRPNSGSGV